MGKIRLEKKIMTEKNRKKSKKELLYTTQMAHLYGGSMISSNSSNSNSHNNNSNFGGSDLAGPPVNYYFTVYCTCSFLRCFRCQPNLGKRCVIDLFFFNYFLLPFTFIYLVVVHLELVYAA